MYLIYRITWIALFSAFSVLKLDLALASSANFRYHCEHYRTKNGKANTHDRSIQLEFDQRFPVKRFIAIENEFGVETFSLSFDEHQYRIRESGVSRGYKLKEEYESLLRLQQALEEFTVTKFKARELRYKLIWQMHPITGELLRSVEAHWGVKNPSGILDLELLPAHRKVIKKEQLPFSLHNPTQHRLHSELQGHSS